MHEWTEGIVGLRLHHQMEMIRHQAQAKKEVNRKCSFGLRKQLEKGKKVGVFVENNRPSVPTIDDMGRSARRGGHAEYEAWNSPLR